MKQLIRLLIVAVVAEIVVCGILIARRTQRPVPVLPAVTYDDPLLADDLALLSAAAETGGSREWTALADLLLGHGFYAYAEQNYRAALELDPDNYAAKFKLAFCLERTGRTAESTEAYEQAIAVAPRETPEFMSVAHARYAIGKNHLRIEATAQAEELFLLNSGFLPADYQMAKAMVRSGRADEAVPMIEALLAEVPESLKLRWLRLRAALALDQPTIAFETELELEWSIYRLQTNFNGSLVEPLAVGFGINRLGAAQQQALQAGDLDGYVVGMLEMLDVLGDRPIPATIALLTQIAQTELQRNNPDAALEAAQLLESLGRHDAELLEIKGLAHALRGELDVAIDLWNRAVQMSLSAQLHDRLAVIFDQQRDLVRRDRHRGESLLIQAKEAYWNQDTAAALDLAEQAAKLIPANPQVWYYLAQARRLSGQKSGVLDALQRCLELNPNHGRALAVQSYLESR